MNLPPITESPTDRHYDGKVVWRDLLTNTPEASRRFYSELFGWEFEAPRVFIGVGGGDVGGLTGVIEAIGVEVDPDLAEALSETNPESLTGRSQRWAQMASAQRRSWSSWAQDSGMWRET